MDQFELVPLKNGVMTLRSLEPRETFHPGIGPVEEATTLHVAQQRLIERCQSIPDFRLWDVGLGAGANAITALRALQQSLPAGHRVSLQSFDKTTAPMIFALDNASALSYPLGFETQVRELLASGRVEVTPQITWQLHLGDFSQTVRDHDLPAPDAILYDPYSAIGNAEMWTLEHFTNLYRRLDPTRVCLLTNYTRSTQIRVSLLLAGFYVGVGSLVHEKNETTIASNNLEALERPLDRDWLEKRVRVSQNAAPLRTASYQQAPISDEDFELLRRHPQFDRTLSCL